MAEGPLHERLRDGRVPSWDSVPTIAAIRLLASRNAPPPADSRDLYRQTLAPIALHE